MKKNIKTIVKYIITPLIAFLLSVSPALAVDYDPNVDYMDRMIQAAIAGDQEALDRAVEQRNAKIKGENLEWAPVSSQELIDTFEERVGFSLTKDYMSEIVRCIINWDYTGGCNAAAKRNIKISYLGMNYQKVTFDEFVLLCKVIYSEAGSNWLPMNWKMCVGEVVLNRVASPEFPNDIRSVVYQRGQYASPSYYTKLYPTTACIQAAVNLLNGQRIMNNPAVVFQANFPQGSGVAMKFYDRYLGSTYFCYSNHMYLYN